MCGDPSGTANRNTPPRSRPSGGTSDVGDGITVGVTNGVAVGPGVGVCAGVSMLAGLVGVVAGVLAFTIGLVGIAVVSVASPEHWIRTNNAAISANTPICGISGKARLVRCDCICVLRVLGTSGGWAEYMTDKA